uniref:Uncharacterized protein n=1 Tax=Eptatretus burgeri TaxID=7764 RepID=A0A8C4NM92_EPTBU
MASDIEEKAKEARITEQKIDKAREHFRPVASRASLLYFIMKDLEKIHPMYQFSLKAFWTLFRRAVGQVEPDEDLQQHIIKLTNNVTLSVFRYTTRGLFECDRLTYTSQLTFQILLESGEISFEEMDFLLRFPSRPGQSSPVDFLTNYSWGGIKVLSTMVGFTNLDQDIEGSPKRWRAFVASEAPEMELFPQDWKNKSAMQKLCVLRVLRPDRMTYAMQDFVKKKLGMEYVSSHGFDFRMSYEESGPSTPMFFILSPGVNPLIDVERHGSILGFTYSAGNLHNVSLGQGQEIVAEHALTLAIKAGHWVILQNIHLVPHWLPVLEQRLQQASESGHTHLRIFLSAEPAPSPTAHCIPRCILERCIKITNEPPSGMCAKLHKALDNFSQDELEMCSRDNEFRSILFALCYFHAVVAERRKFGPQGWNQLYPFSTGDLLISSNVLLNYLEANAKVPWNDLCYLFGEIMYGGYITDEWDRRLCRTYLQQFLQPKLLEGDQSLAPGFLVPPFSDLTGYHHYVDTSLPPESPHLYGLHPNAEVGFLSRTSEQLFLTVLLLQPGDRSYKDSGGLTREEKVKEVINDIQQRLPEGFSMGEMLPEQENQTPYTMVMLQECECANLLINEIRHSLKELNQGLEGELTMTTSMEDLLSTIFFDKVPAGWTRYAYPSLASLGAWFSDFFARMRQLETWSLDLATLPIIWLSGLFNPQAFLMAILQVTARRCNWPLDSISLQCNVTKKSHEEVVTSPRDGAFVYGMFAEGARWDVQAGVLAESRLMELCSPMPVILLHAVPHDRQDARSLYACPLYRTRERGNTFVWAFNLPSREDPAKWTLAGVALLLQA